MNNVMETIKNNKTAALSTLVYFVIIVIFLCGAGPATVLITAPNLEREYAAPADIPSDYVAIVDRQIKEKIAAIQKDNEDIVSWISLATLRQSIRDYAGAEEILLYVIAKNPNGLIAYNNVGSLYASYLKDNKKAEKAFLKVIELDPSYIAGYRNLYELYRSGYKQDSDTSVSILNQGLESNTENIEILMMLAAHFLEKKDVEAAKGYFGRALVQAEKGDDAEVVAFIKEQIEKLGK